MKRTVELLENGSFLLGISYCTRGIKIDFETLHKYAPLPCIVPWNQNHFVVVYKITRKTVYVSDPGAWRISYTHEEFMHHWVATRIEDQRCK